MRIAIYNLQRTYLLRDDFRIGLVISPKVVYLTFWFLNIYLHIKNYHQIIYHTQWWHHKSYNNIGCDDMEYTEDAIDNMILEFSRD